MKNIFYILLLLPTIIFAQYPSNSGQKITLGEQTTADGLVWRGRLNDTSNLLTNKLDTSVYIVLDTGTRAMWYYRASTTPKWTRLVDSLNNLQGQLSLTTKVTDVLPVANGGTNLSTFTAANRIPYSTSATALTTNSNFTYDGNRLTIPEAIFNGTTNYGYIFSAKASTSSGGAGIFIRGTQGSDNTLPTTFGYPYVNIGGVENKQNAIQTIGFGFTNGTGGFLSPAEIGYLTNSVNGFTNGHLVFATREFTTNVAPDEKMRITNAGNVGIGTTLPAEKLVVTGAIMSTSGITGHGANRTTISQEGANGAFWQSYGANTSTAGIFQLRQASSDFSIQRVPLYIDASGNVGIGTTSPSEKLHVVGNGLFIGSVTANSLSLTTPLSVANGGTGQSTPTLAINALLPAQSQSTTIGATLKSNGTNTYWDNFSAAGTVQDQSGNFYNTVAIGTQVWFKENLRTKKYRSGALIPVKTNTDTSTLVGQMYYYSNDSLTNYSVYGALYNWKATQSSDSLCPVGWHVPTDTELTTLTTFLGGSGVAGGKIKSTGTTYWSSPNTGATNETGFSVLPGGIRTSNTGLFILINSITAFWTSTEFPNSNSAYYREIVNSNDDIGRGTDTKSAGFFVRCLKN